MWTFTDNTTEKTCLTSRFTIRLRPYLVQGCTLKAVRPLRGNHHNLLRQHGTNDTCRPRCPSDKVRQLRATTFNSLGERFLRNDSQRGAVNQLVGKHVGKRGGGDEGEETRGAVPTFGVDVFDSLTYGAIECLLAEMSLSSVVFAHDA